MMILLKSSRNVVKSASQRHSKKSGPNREEESQKGIAIK